LAYFKRNFATLCLSVLCIVGYGGMIRGVLPTAAAVSWEGHVAGLLTGIAAAWFWARLENTPTS
jgi:membrane associated rhomboid family serine protease